MRTIFLFLLPISPAHAECVSFDAAKVQLAWTAYKTTAKVPVTGQFASASFASPSSAASLPELLAETRFEVDLRSSTTGKGPRDQNLLNGFFQHVAKGHAMGTLGDVRPGSFTARLSLNGVTRDVPFAYTVDAQNVFHAAGSLTMPDFSLEGALASLDALCHDVHAGADGVSKVWPQVDLSLTAPLGSECR